MHFLLRSFLTLSLVLISFNISFGKNLKELTAEVSNETFKELEEDDYINICSLGCALNWEITASSSLKDDSNKFSPVKVDDGNVHTAWITGKSNSGAVESITYFFPKKQFDRYSNGSVPLNGISIVSGYTKNLRKWKEFSRAKKLRIYLQDELLFTLNLQDTFKNQNFDFKSVDIKPKSKLRMEIADVYPGTLHKNVAISEILLSGAH